MSTTSRLVTKIERVEGSRDYMVTYTRTIKPWFFGSIKSHEFEVRGRAGTWNFYPKGDAVPASIALWIIDRVRAYEWREEEKRQKK